jgi:hypothetical protein
VYQYQIWHQFITQEGFSSSTNFLSQCSSIKSYDMIDPSQRQEAGVQQCPAYKLHPKSDPNEQSKALASCKLSSTSKGTSLLVHIALGFTCAAYGPVQATLIQFSATRPSNHIPVLIFRYASGLHPAPTQTVTVPPSVAEPEEMTITLCGRPVEDLPTPQTPTQSLDTFWRHWQRLSQESRSGLGI